MIKIVTDSTNYLPPDLIARHDVRVVPLYLMFDHEAYRESVDIDTERFFARFSAEATFPTTSQPTTLDFVSAWRPLLDAGHEVIAILLSGHLSSAAPAARAAARSTPGEGAISIVDSRSIAMGLGMQVLRAAELAAEGRSLSEILTAVERIKEAVHIVLVVDTLEYMQRGGRINVAKAWLGTLLNVKPLLTLREGVVVPLEQVRTSRRAIARLLEWTTNYLGRDRYPWIAVMHSRSPGVAQELLAVLETRFPEARFFCSEIGPVLGAHIGPGGAGIIACPGTALF